MMIPNTQLFRLDWLWLLVGAFSVWWSLFLKAIALKCHFLMVCLPKCGFFKCFPGNLLSFSGVSFLVLQFQNVFSICCELSSCEVLTHLPVWSPRLTGHVLLSIGYVRTILFIIVGGRGMRNGYPRACQGVMGVLRLFLKLQNSCWIQMASRLHSGHGSIHLLLFATLMLRNGWLALVALRKRLIALSRTRSCTRCALVSRTILRIFCCNLIFMMLLLLGPFRAFYTERRRRSVRQRSSL